MEQALIRNRAAQQAKAAPLPSVVPTEQLTLVATSSESGQRGLSVNERIRAMLAEMDDELDANTERMIANYVSTKAQEIAHDPNEMLPPSVAAAVPNHEPVASLREAKAGPEASLNAREETTTQDADKSTLIGQKADVDATKLRAEEKRDLRSGSAACSPEQRATDDSKTSELRKQKPRFPELIEGLKPFAKDVNQDEEFGA